MRGHQRRKERRAVVREDQLRIRVQCDRRHRAVGDRDDPAALRLRGLRDARRFLRIRREADDDGHALLRDRAQLHLERTGDAIEQRHGRTEQPVAVHEAERDRITRAKPATCTCDALRISFAASASACSFCAAVADRLCCCAASRSCASDACASGRTSERARCVSGSGACARAPRTGRAARSSRGNRIAARAARARRAAPARAGRPAHRRGGDFVGMIEQEGSARLELQPARKIAPGSGTRVRRNWRPSWWEREPVVHGITGPRAPVSAALRRDRRRPSRCPTICARIRRSPSLRSCR